MIAGAATRLPGGAGSGSHLFRVAAGLALALHAVLIFGRAGVWGGGDLIPHLRIIEAMRESPGLYNPYAPAYHALGALLVPALGVELYTKLAALAAALALIAGFRSFQCAAGLPDAAAALFALTPYLLSLSFCTPKVEAAGYGLLLLGLGLLWRERRVATALALAATFYVHTASALLFGLAGGLLCLARSDARGLAALACGSLGAAPLLVAHLGAGCSLPEALLLGRGGLARPLREAVLPDRWPWLVPLANPVTLVAAALGARETWRRGRPLGVLCLGLTLAYLNNLWLAPLEVRTLVTLLRGLSLLAIPVAIAAGIYAAGSPRRTAWVVGLAALWCVASAPLVVPRACFVRQIDVERAAAASVERCTFVWQEARMRR